MNLLIRIGGSDTIEWHGQRNDHHPTTLAKQQEAAWVSIVIRIGCECLGNRRAVVPATTWAFATAHDQSLGHGGTI